MFAGMANPLVMERDAAQSFLAGLHVGVLAVARSSGPPVLTPIWYRYEPGGDVAFSIGRGSAKAKALRAAGVASLCAQSEQLPYAFVTVDGPVVVVDAAADEDLRTQIAIRYLGDELGAAYIDSTKGGDNVLARLTPVHWRSNDYGKVLRG
jgi:PPOX class probable F420-dependent enzyme